MIGFRNSVVSCCSKLSWFCNHIISHMFVWLFGEAPLGQFALKLSIYIDSQRLLLQNVGSIHLAHQVFFNIHIQIPIVIFLILILLHSFLKFCLTAFGESWRHCASHRTRGRCPHSKSEQQMEHQVLCVFCLTCSILSTVLLN